MKKILKIIAFQIGVDVLGFPKIHEHELTYLEKNNYHKNFFRLNSRTIHLKIVSSEPQVYLR